MTETNIFLAKSYKMIYSHDIDLSKKHDINKWVRVLLFKIQEYNCLKLDAFQGGSQYDYLLRATSLHFGDQKRTLPLQVTKGKK